MVYFIEPTTISYFGCCMCFMWHKTHNLVTPQAVTIVCHFEVDSSNRGCRHTGHFPSRTSWWPMWKRRLKNVRRKWIIFNLIVTCFGSKNYTSHTIPLIVEFVLRAKFINQPRKNKLFLFMRLSNVAGPVVHKTQHSQTQAHIRMHVVRYDYLFIFTKNIVSKAFHIQCFIIVWCEVDMAAQQ